MSKAVPMISSEPFESPIIPMIGLSVGWETGEAELTCDEERKANRNNANIPERPEISGIESSAGIHIFANCIGKSATYFVL
jgi:hypothetical protein